MPAILTHDFFGKDAFEIAAGRLGFATLEEQELHVHIVRAFSVTIFWTPRRIHLCFPCRTV